MKRRYLPTPTARLQSHDTWGRGAVGLMALTLLLGGVLSQTLQAGERAAFSVRLIDGAAKPVVGAAVCLSPKWHRHKTLRAITDTEGLAHFPHLKPDTHWQLLASKTNFQSASLSFDSRHYPLTLTQTLQAGWGDHKEACLSAESSARLQAQQSSTASQGAQTLQLLGVSVQPDAEGWRMQPRYSGKATHFRLSAQKDMSGATWQVLANNGAFSAEPWPQGGYLQLKRTLSHGASWIEQESNVLPLP